MAVTVEHMIDEEYVAQKKRVQKLISKWVKPIGLGYWTIRFDWYSELLPSETATELDRVVMVCHADWRYLNATIQVNLCEVGRQSDEDLERIFVHELMHIFLNEMREQGIQHEERVAEQLAKAFIWSVGNIERDAAIDN